MKNVYYVGSDELTFELIERIINENLKLELAKNHIMQQPEMNLKKIRIP